MPKQVVFPVDEDLVPAKRELLISRLIYSLPAINSCAFTEKKDGIVVSVDPEFVERIEPIFNDILAEVASSRAYSQEIKETNCSCQSLTSVARPSVQSLSDSSRESALHLIEKKLKQKLFPDGHDCRIYSSLLPQSALDRCNYLETFPQNLYMVDQFPHDYSIMRDAKNNDLSSAKEASGLVLTPATCFHVYDNLAESRLPGNTISFAKSRCFRHEAEWRLSKSRAREFDMLEAVFIGDNEFVEHERTTLIDKTWALFCELGLRGSVETAHDPFYHSEDQGKAQFQIMTASKYELVYNSPHSDLKLAIASFNNVGNSLCEKFHISTESLELPNSGCVAFGLDRWVVALEDTYGDSIADWPI